jgi:uncharacterized protein YkwD
VRSPRNVELLALAALGMALAGSTAIATPPAAPPSADTAQDAIVEAINRDRSRLALAPLSLHATLRRVAQRQADELEREGDLDSDLLAVETVVRWLEEASYPVRRVVEGVVVSADPPAEAATFWALNNPNSYGAFLEADLREIGVGVARVEGVPVYTVVAALSAEAEFDQQAAALADLAAVRREMLERVNRERRAEGLAPLRRQAALETAAQSYAEEMLRGGFYDHVSPRGETVLERAKAAGYRVQRVGENIATGQGSVEVVMDGWMQSPPHRANLLSPMFTDFGVGVATGKTADGFKILWVQCFGRPR